MQSFWETLSPQYGGIDQTCVPSVQYFFWDQLWAYSFVKANIVPEGR